MTRTARTNTLSGCKTIRGLGTPSNEYSTLIIALASLSTSNTNVTYIFIYSSTYNKGIYINYKGLLTLYKYILM